MVDDLKRRLDELIRRMKSVKPENEAAVQAEIKELFTAINAGIKTYENALEQLRSIAAEFKDKRGRKTSMNQFYSFIKSRTATELDVSTLIDRSWNLICVGEYDEAAKTLEQVVAVEPKNTRAIGLLALTLMNRENYDAAMLRLQQVIMIEPENAFARNNLGFICYKKGIWGEAIEHLAKAAKQKKDRLAALYANYYLGLVYRERNMLADAVKFFEQALALGPNLQEAHYYLGVTEMQRCEFAKAVGHFDSCIKIDRGSRYGNMARAERDKIMPLLCPEVIMHRINKNVRRSTRSVH